MIIKKPENFFYVCDGETLDSSKEMLEWLKNSDDDTFSHHVNSERNDLVGWIRSILKDNILSRKIEKAKDRKEMIEITEERLASKKRKTKKSLISQIKDAIING